MQADSHPMDAATSGPANPSASRPIVVFHVELACLLCGRALGTLQIRQWPSRGPGTLRPIGPTPACQLADWCRLRCLVCGGNIYPDEVEAVRVYPPVQWENERPPPNRCAGCERPLKPASEAIEGQFPVALRDYLLVIRCRVCRDCLDRPELRDAFGLRNESLLILSHLCGWYAAALKGAGPSDATVPVHRIVCNRNRGARH